ncbi:hypothetical protein ACHFJ0_00540 [Paracoccus sp. NGMCC 1.201697]|uniref:PIN domain-containing protein n=1 Tax=Paracoccus broussonetiae subsp. drimophilus TaxID=3373869 RepID=A0ABW7LEB4_9RHOB
MKEFIIDKNVDVVSSNEEYPAYFFDDLKKSARVRIVLGGTNYKREVREKAALRELVSQLISANRVRSVSDATVDGHEQALRTRIIDICGSCPQECDDHHIFALAHVSGCRNILTKDRRMASCRDQIRNRVGHDFCPDIRLVMSEAAYRDT